MRLFIGQVVRGLLAMLEVGDGGWLGGRLGVYYELVQCSLMAAAARVYLGPVVFVGRRGVVVSSGLVSWGVH